jgi:hypothetical protein
MDHLVAIGTECREILFGVLAAKFARQTMMHRQSAGQLEAAHNTAMPVAAENSSNHWLFTTNSHFESPKNASNPQARRPTLRGPQHNAKPAPSKNVCNFM